MTWRGVAIIYAALVVLVSVAVTLEHRASPSAAVDLASPTQSLLGTDASALSAIVFARDGKKVRAVRETQRWRAVEPPGTSVSADLIEATVATLTAGQSAEMLTVAPEADLAAYGLDTPAATLEIAMQDGSQPPITVSIGGANPTRTAVYARRSDRPAIFLVGMNLRYYIDLIFDAAKG